MSIKLINEPKETETEYCFPGGLSDFVKYLDGNEDLIHDEVIVVNKEDIEVPVDLALRYSTNYNSNIFSFVNNINTIEGGTHLSGFRSALTRALNSYANKNDLIKTKKNEKFSRVLRGRMGWCGVVLAAISTMAESYVLDCAVMRIPVHF